jgi:hypothetical protein
MTHGADPRFLYSQSANGTIMQRDQRMFGEISARTVAMHVVQRAALIEDKFEVEVR